MYRKKNIVIAASLAVAAAVATAIVLLQFPMLPSEVQTQNPTQGEEYNYEVRKLKIDDVMLYVEIADDSGKIQKGLMFREKLPEGQGMLFIFDQEREYQFWMMNMQFNLDIIWINSQGRVVHIVEDAEPCIDAAHTSLCTFRSDEPTKYVLEVNSGFVKRYGISEESIMQILT